MQGKAVLAGALVAGVLGAAPATAGAAEVTAFLDGGEPFGVAFSSAPGEANALRVTRTGTSVLFDDVVPITDADPTGTCNQQGEDVVCTLERGGISASLGDQDDSVVLEVPEEHDIHTSAAGDAGADLLVGGPHEETLNGGDGGDTLHGNGGDDSLHGDAGDDVARGGPGDDGFGGGSDDPGADQLIGDTGVDAVFYEGRIGGANAPVVVTLDGLANDGVPGEGDNAQVEDVAFDNDGVGSVVNQVFGDAGPNQLMSFSAEPSVLDGGGGNDLLLGGDGGDELRARDGFADRVQCGFGTDRVASDAFDVVSDTCESVDAAATEYATEDRPPAVAFLSPAAGTLLRTALPSLLTVQATDDRGIARVLLFDDGQVVGTDTTAPFQFAYGPRGGDVGSNTLAAVAVDTAGQTTSAFLPVRVDRFAPVRVRSATTPARDREAPYRFVTSGRVDLPPRVTRAQGCGEGVVSVQIKRGTRTVSTRRVELSSSCTFRSTVVFRDRARLGTGRLRVQARFLGNEVLARRTAATDSVRAG